MLEEILRVSLADLMTVRIVCGVKNCGSIIETNIHKLQDFEHFICPRCQNKIQAPSDLSLDYLHLLGKSIEGLRAAGVQVQFTFFVRQHG